MLTIFSSGMRWTKDYAWGYLSWSESINETAIVVGGSFLILEGNHWDTMEDLADRSYQEVEAYYERKKEECAGFWTSDRRQEDLQAALAEEHF